MSAAEHTPQITTSHSQHNNITSSPPHQLLSGANWPDWCGCYLLISSLRSEEAFIWRLDRHRSYFSTAIWWVDEYRGSCKINCPFRSHLCSELHFSTRIRQESPNWSCPWLQIANLRDRLQLQAWSKFTASSARQQDFLPWIEGSKSRKDRCADWWEIPTICTVNYCSFCQTFDNYIFTCRVTDLRHDLPNFEFLIDVA